MSLSKSQQVRFMFAGIARRYDLLNHLLSFQIDRWWRRTAVRASRANSTSRVLDLCAGTGDFSFAFARKAGSVVGTDFCPEMIHLAQQKNSRWKGRCRPHFALADALALPFEKDSFDIVSVAFGIRNLENWRLGLQEMARVAKPGGRILILEFFQPRRRFFGKLHLFYFSHFVPTLGRWISGNSQAYRYLPDSVMTFASPEEIMQAMKEQGLEKIECRPLTGGIATMIQGEKR